MKAQTSCEVVVFEAIGVEWCSTKRAPCQGVYLHRIPRELVHYNRELWLVKCTRDVLDEEAEGVLILLGGHFEEREGCGLESATASERRWKRIEIEATKWLRLAHRGALSPFCHHHLRLQTASPLSRFRMRAPYWSLIATVFEVSLPSNPQPSLPLKSCQSAVHSRSIHPLCCWIYSRETWYLGQEDSEGASLFDFCRPRLC